MRNYLQDYCVVSCPSLQEALMALQGTPAPIPMAGGTDLMVYLNYRRLPAGSYLDLFNIPELKQGIQIQDNKVVFSALTTYMDVRMHPYFQNNMKLLLHAAKVVGAIGIQTRGTWAGNIINASPAADGVPALMVYDAKITLASAYNERQVLLSDFYHGYKKMDRSPQEIITKITIPIPQTKDHEYYRKVGERKAQAISKVILAGRLSLDGQKKIQSIRIVYGSVMPYTYRSNKTEELLLGNELNHKLIQEAVSLIGKELQPIDDIRSTALYRRKVAQNLLEEFLCSAL
ncbi:MAG: FAD binding domain-containing protein [Candidatus Brocadiae bacterium]|nr:FAD binding domain-containing protein [Candidatus Brocadiia bacterium]